MPLVDDLMVANLYRANFRYSIARRPCTRRLDVYHDVILLGANAVSDPADLRTDAGVLDADDSFDRRQKHGPCIQGYLGLN